MMVMQRSANETQKHIEYVAIDIIIFQYRHYAPFFSNTEFYANNSAYFVVFAHFFQPGRLSLFFSVAFPLFAALEPIFAAIFEQFSQTFRISLSFTLSPSLSILI